MGNRGILHNDAQKIVRPWAHKSWVTCLLSFQGIKRPLFSEGNYSELFFLDEATSLAAGHRPCNTCQPEKFRKFKETWLKANMPETASTFVAIAAIDKALHAERAIRGGGKLTYDAILSELPTGAMFEYKNQAFLVWKQGILRWSFEGYSPANAIPRDTIVHVLTPKSITRTLQYGYLPEVHHTAGIGQAA